MSQATPRPTAAQQRQLTRIEQAVLDAAQDPILQHMLEQERIESEEVDTSLLVRLLGYLRPHRAFTALCLGLIAIQALLMTLPAYAIGLALDVVRGQEAARQSSVGLSAALEWLAQALVSLLPASWITRPSVGQMVGYASLIVLIWVVRWLFATVATYSVQRLGQRIVHDLRLDVYHHITSMDMSYFHKHPVGRLVNRTTFDTQSLSEFFSDAFSQGVLDVLFILSLVLVMSSLDVTLALVLVLTLPLLLATAELYRRIARPAMRTTSAVISRMNGWLAENISGMRENQLYGVATRRRGEFGALTDAHQASVHRMIQAWGFLRPVMMVVCALATAVVLWRGYVRVLDGIITVGVLLTFLQYTTRLWVPVRNLAEKFNVIQTALTAAERIFDVLGTPSAMHDLPQADPSLAINHGRISLEDVTFSYPSKPGEPILRGVSFEVEPGKMLALVGDTGAGKSTIIHLLSRFYDVSGGAVRLDGHDVRDYTLAQLRAGIALVPQDVVIFAGTIRENITLGLEVEEDRLWECVRAVCADRFVNRFSDGLDHVMDEAGRTLSAGERQLLSFARALVFNPPILILDEATANVDTETEALIQLALEHLTAGRTSVVIAHRLSTIREADQILVMRHGQIVERGRHHELLAQGGEYARLHELHMSAHN